MYCLFCNRISPWTKWPLFHRRHFCRVQVIINQHWLRQWLGSDLAISHYPNQCWLSSLTHICSTRERRVQQSMSIGKTCGLWMYVYSIFPCFSHCIFDLEGLQHKSQKSCSRCNKNTWHIESSYILQPPKILLLFVNRFRYINNNVTKDRCPIPMDTTVRLGPLKFSLRATIDHHGPSIHSGHYTASINCCKNILLQRSHNLGVWNYSLKSSTAYVILLRVTLYTAGHLHAAVPHCLHSRAPIVHTAVPRENNEHGCVYLRCRAVCKLPGCVEGHPWLLLGFVRTRVLMSRSRLNNGATHGGWHFDIHRDFDTRGR